MRTFVSLASTSIIVSMLSASAIFAAPSSSIEVSCGNYGADAVSCNQCFDGGTDYVGDTTAKNFSDSFTNAGSDYLLLPQSNGLYA